MSVGKMKKEPGKRTEKYTFDAKESAAFTAVFEQEKEEVDKSHLKEAIRHAEEQMQDEKYQDVIPVVREEYEEAYKNAKAIDEEARMQQAKKWKTRIRH